MLTKWFIGVNAKSKGYFTGFQWSGEAKPSFTKQSALATCFNTKEDAQEWINDFAKHVTYSIKEDNDKVKDYKELQSRWPKLKFEDQKASLSAVGLYSGYHRYGYSSQNRTEEETHAKFDFNLPIGQAQNRIRIHNKQIDFLAEKIVIRQDEIEIKFMDREKRPIKWETRKDNQTSGDYCNLCGGAVPGIPQLEIGSGWRNSDSTRICAICMGKLAEEATVQAGKVSEEIMTHYETDRFLRNL